MSSVRATRIVVVGIPEGLHARPAELLARTALKFQSHVELINGSLRADAKSILHLISLGAPQGTQLTIEAVGDDAQQAVDAIEQLVAGGFTNTESVQTERAKSN
jgi:phosphotransferase system HPr (HPr) family protein